MNRLTKRIGGKVYYTKGKYSPATLCGEMETWEVRECMEKLAKYEDLEEKRTEYVDRKVYGTIEEVEQTLSLLEDIKRREKELGFSGPDLDMQIESEKIKLEALGKLLAEARLDGAK